MIGKGKKPATVPPRKVVRGEKVRCRACSGTGLDSRGGACQACTVMRKRSD
jgi:hypothetical protein